MGRITIRDHDAILPLNGFIGHSLGQIDGEEDGIHLTANGVEWSFKQDCDTVLIVCQPLGSVSDSRPVLSKLLSANSSGYLQ